MYGNGERCIVDNTLVEVSVLGLYHLFNSAVHDSQVSELYFEYLNSDGMFTDVITELEQYRGIYWIFYHCCNLFS